MKQANEIADRALQREAARDREERAATAPRLIGLLDAVLQSMMGTLAYLHEGTIAGSAWSDLKYGLAAIGQGVRHERDRGDARLLRARIADLMHRSLAWVAATEERIDVELLSKHPTRTCTIDDMTPMCKTLHALVEEVGAVPGVVARKHGAFDEHLVLWRERVRKPRAA